MERFDDTFRELLDSQKLLFPCVGEVVSASGAYIDVKPVIKFEGTEAPVLKSVPVPLLLGTAGWKIDFSLAAGDKVLLIFGAHPIPLWTTDDKNELELAKPELHHAIAIPIQISGGVKVENATGTVFEISDTGVDITGNLTVSGNVTAGTATPATQVGLLTHTHPIGDPNTGAPNPGI